MFKFLKLDHKILNDALQTENHFPPISICFVISLLLIYFGNQFSKTTTLSNSKQNELNYVNTKAKSLYSNSISERIGIINLLVYFLILIISGTFLLLYLIRNNYIKFIKYWFILAYFVVMFLFNFIILQTLFRDNSFLVIDNITIFLFLWNFCRYILIFFKANY